ncbi:helix-turn-helix domain-containing protein [Arthrobacter sp. ISL-65]|uniref:helix-turn-helix domain-containing protein n=1 Tax=Arthrobacter sp. ISL-65 TaxID=2819112 RepID=UPI0027E19EB2|nr:helix-turn-helix domain-containing protein [Arthrobacter sp. ISL-65]
MTDEPRTRRRFLTIEQAAEELNVSESQIRALLRSGDLRRFQVGGRGMWALGLRTSKTTSPRLTAGPQNASPRASPAKIQWTPDASAGHQLFVSWTFVASVQERPAPSGQIPPQHCCAPVQTDTDGLQQEEYQLHCACQEQEQPKDAEHRKKHEENGDHCRQVSEGVAKDRRLIHCSPITGSGHQVLTKSPSQRG